MKKQGFTLIELMVVIVIMGILAAVAVPKLFGMIAKSKASELGPAAGTYVKLQDAYVAEVGTHAGNWANIGYVMSNSNNFVYCATATTCGTTAAAGTAGVDETQPTDYVAHWTATTRATLNDCQSASNWTLVTSQNGSQGGLVLYTATNPCTQLTPNFSNLNTAN